MGAVLPPIYGPGAAERVLEDFESAPIPDLHKAMFRFVGKLTRRSWEIGPADLDGLRTVGLRDADIVLWAQIAALQGWWTMSADGSGIPLDGDALTGPVLGRTREWYGGAPEGLTAVDAPGTPEASGAVERASGPGPIAWVDRGETGEAWERAAARARERYGFVPNLWRAVSLEPAFLRRHELALELLERPQSATLSPRLHALLRHQTARIHRSRYMLPTAEAALARAGARADEPLDAVERTVLGVGAKVARHAYKVVPEDAAAFREAGLGDEGYVDALNAVAIETSFDRLANALGVAPDAAPLLAS